ncbi:unnamed protein product, partial [marine sediment metagenome]
GSTKISFRKKIEIILFFQFPYEFDFVAQKLASERRLKYK